MANMKAGTSSTNTVSLRTLMVWAILAGVSYLAWRYPDTVTPMVLAAAAYPAVDRTLAP